LHLVFVNEERRRATCADRLEQVRSMILRAASAKSDLLSRVGLLPDHVHLILGFDPEMAPIDVALRYMNNIAFVYDMQPVLMPSCYLGTVGQYDLGAVRL
jgi:REP element-mobilizing transposase RayT